MATAAHRLLGPRVRTGLVVTSFAAQVPGPFETIVGGHPTPTGASERAGLHALALARSLAPDELLLLLLSGGASALMAAPADRISLDDKRDTSSRLMRAGADIHALNTVRKHLSAIKGGQLAAAAAGPSVTLAISDVVGDDLSVIGSGPSVADPSTFEDALRMLQRFGGVESYPPPVVERLTFGARGALQETPKPGDARLARATARVIGGRRDAMAGAEKQAVRLGYHVHRVDEAVVGEARHAAASYLRTVFDRAGRLERPVCVIASGETTVRVTGTGRGGRNQEFALAAAETLASMDARAALASVGTDGIDGPTDAAGAIVDTATSDRMRLAGLDAARFFNDNNTYELFSRLGDLIHTGPTGTNVGDLHVVLLA
jgi:hydroxypyruvate reductase